jgi:hypothetical protein
MATREVSLDPEIGLDVAVVGVDPSSCAMAYEWCSAAAPKLHFVVVVAQDGATQLIMRDRYAVAVMRFTTPG